MVSERARRLHRHLTPFAAAQRSAARKIRPSFSAAAPDLPFDRSPELRRRCRPRVRHRDARGKCPIGIFGIPSTAASVLLQLEAETLDLRRRQRRSERLNTSM